MYHNTSPKHLHGYVNEFAGRHSPKEFDMIDQTTWFSVRMVGRRLKYEGLIGAPGTQLT